MVQMGKPIIKGLGPPYGTGGKVPETLVTPALSRRYLEVKHCFNKETRRRVRRSVHPIGADGQLIGQLRIEF